ncbi:MAG: hypothetical protein HY709_03775, partial [Candidatus Latescibacteria bacterium]|nr:hypothetical protein [Candidatus Latescibacterota bacterium]
PQPISPEADTGVTTSSPSLIAQRPEGLEPGADLYFEVDQRPLFDGASLQTSRDRPLLFQSLKPYVIGVGLGAGLGLFVLLSILGLPVLLIFGYVRSLTGLPHTVITEVVGALLARYYFWRKYGRQQWRLYAAVLAVGFAVGMSLMGMASVGIAIIQKSTSTALY